MRNNPQKIEFEYTASGWKGATILFVIVVHIAVDLWLASSLLVWLLKQAA